jgi:hypothetical protein
METQQRYGASLSRLRKGAFHEGALLLHHGQPFHYSICILEFFSREYGNRFNSYILRKGMVVARLFVSSLLDIASRVVRSVLVNLASK